MTTYTVRAKRWLHGWELHIDGVGVTQSRSLGDSERMVRDYIESLTDRDMARDKVVITPEIGGGLDQAAQAARDGLAEAESALRAAAARSRKVARELQQAGLSGRDIAQILKVSAQRVSQLLKEHDRHGPKGIAMAVDQVAIAAAALVAAMTTDSWEAVRHEVAQLFGRGHPDPVIERRLDATRDQLAAAPPNESASVQAAVADQWRTRLSDLLADHPDAAGELAVLVGKLAQVAWSEATSNLTTSD
jgi:predicted transcriptional regulator